MSVGSSHSSDAALLSFLWLEVTGQCQLECEHCYADSGPGGTHGVMTYADWRTVIDQAAALGVRMVQFIGGEPTLHPDLPALIDCALSRRVQVEVFTNLVHVRPALWEVFTRPGVRLATSYYSNRAVEHERITRRRGSHRRTHANLAEAVRRGIHVRVGVIDLHDGQGVTSAQRELEALGVTSIGTDRLRHVGRGARDQEPGIAQLCGQCANGTLAVAPDGTVWPCVFARWLRLGNVRESTLGAILRSNTAMSTRDRLRARFAAIAREASDARCKPACFPPPPDCGPTCPRSARRTTRANQVSAPRTLDEGRRE